ncbi:hypothetical protein PR003_g1033 [Phytophthora rubi]|uniref:Reverse transcriptase Ty1/copia-type domain-containing protein n=1 Tax=Phytophthora rubi TaxID=129364 RepID=A0A6A4G4D9_9STRA|nr:hypothetical protein PR002_g957 [Phytophthora rubi]KAE9051783.1 hypothetical protein PR001_g1117 [Phytophthora rubi]KAE9358920.1 hypothetical protein PR003_g1033 [Phytophthora rubi]
MWNRKPDIHHLRKFGAPAYVHSKVGPSRHKFTDHCRVGFTLRCRENALGSKVYFPTEGSVLFGGQVTVNEQVLYKDRHGPAFEDNIRQRAVDAYPDLTSTGRRNYDLPAVGEREYGAGVLHGGSDDEEALEDDEATVGEVQRVAEAPHASWMSREPSVFNDDIVFTNPVQPSSGKTDEHRGTSAESQDLEGDQEAGASGPDVDSAAGSDYRGDQDMDATKSEEGCRQNDDEAEGDYSDAGEDETFGSYSEDDSHPYDGPDVQSQQSNHSRDECEADSGDETIVPEPTPPILTGHRRVREDEESVLSGEAEKMRNRTGLVTIADDDEQDAFDGFALYAAVGVAATMETEPEQRLWHESEVRLPRTFKQAMPSPQLKEWWKGMKRELAAMEEKDVLELVPEGVMTAGKKALQIMWRFQIKTDSNGNVVRFRPR